MIIKSFFRNRTTKIYLALFLVLFTFILLINIAYNHINKLIVDNLIDSTLAYTSCSYDCYAELVSSKKVTNIRYSYLSEQTIKEDYLGTFNSISDDDKLLISENKDLKDDEVILYYNEAYYKLDKEIIDNIKIIHIGDTEYSVKELRLDSNVSRIELSSHVIQSLKDDNNYTYIFNLKVPYEEVSKELNNINNLTMKTSDKNLTTSTLNKQLRTTKIFIIILMMISIIIYGIVLCNLFFDFNTRNRLEKYLGFTKLQRKINCYKRLTILIFLSLLIALIVALFISLIVSWIFIKGLVIKFNYYILIYLLIIEVIKFIFLLIIRA